MKTFVSLTIAVLVGVLLLATSVSSAKNGDDMTVGSVLKEIRSAQGIGTDDEIDCDKVTDPQLDKLGAALMQVAHPNSRERSRYERMMGGKDSPLLTSMYRMMGARYLDCYEGGAYGQGGMGWGGGWGGMMGPGWYGGNGQMMGPGWYGGGDGDNDPSGGDPRTGAVSSRYGYGKHMIMGRGGYGYYGGFGYSAWSWFFWIIVIGAIVVLIYFLIRPAGRWYGYGRYGGYSGRWYGEESDNAAMDILRGRYARGEITKEEFEEMREVLEQRRSSRH
jgi:putative membrane protein